MQTTKNILKLEDKNFRINSTGWEKRRVHVGETEGGDEYLVNPEGDVWEILSGKHKGEQLFTWDAARRETEKAGKRILTVEEMADILKTKEDVSNLIFAGYFEKDGLRAFYDGQGRSAYFWTSGNRKSDVYGNIATCFFFTSRSENVACDEFVKSAGLSVRCIRQ